MADEDDLIIKKSAILRGQPVMSYDVLPYDLSKTYQIGDVVRNANNEFYLSITNANLGNSLIDTTNWLPFCSQDALNGPIDATTWEFIRGNRADSELRSKQPDLAQGGLILTTYKGTNPVGGFNGGGVGNKASLGYRGLNGLNLNEIEYVRVRIQGLERDPATSEQPPGFPNPLAIDNFFYLNFFINTSLGPRALTGSYFFGTTNGLDNPSGLPVRANLTDITFRPQDAIWVIVGNANEFGLVGSNVGSIGQGLPLTTNFTEYNTATMNDTSLDGGVEAGKTAPSIMINLGGSGPGEYRKVRITELEFKLTSSMTSVFVSFV